MNNIDLIIILENILYILLEVLLLLALQYDILVTIRAINLKVTFKIYYFYSNSMDEQLLILCQTGEAS